ncbi:ribonuclease T [uncultured Aggregatibacter sp.]|uniref:ribonuclease T n=1 Tax=uncultured Aggregatibacter sp. TaxID=470564 RepID=UPI0025D7ACD1|nr:ribonuclease T [uncultured Aggregatibacter sp.]
MSDTQETINYHLLKHRFRGYLPVIIDVETAGLNAKTDALLELAAITVKMDEQGNLLPDQKCHFHIQPFEGANINPEAIKFNGIDVDNPLRGAVSENIAISEMFKMVRRAQKEADCQRSIIVAHNAAFDQGFIMAAAQRTNAKRNPFHPFSTFDTATLSGFMFGQTVLIKACQVANIPFDSRQAHSALYDTERTAELFCYMVNHLKALGGFPHLVTKE